MKFLKISYFFENSLYGGPIFYDFPLVKVNGFILVSESLPEIISASSKAVNYIKGYNLNLGY